MRLKVVHLISSLQLDVCVMPKINKMLVMCLECSKSHLPNRVQHTLSENVSLQPTDTVLSDAFRSGHCNESNGGLRLFLITVAKGPRLGHSTVQHAVTAVEEDNSSVQREGTDQFKTTRQSSGILKANLELHSKWSLIFHLSIARSHIRNPPITLLPSFTLLPPGLSAELRRGRRPTCTIISLRLNVLSACIVTLFHCFPCTTHL